MNRSVAVVLSLLILSLLASCGDSGSPPRPEPDIDATVEARVAKALEESTPSPAPPPTSAPTTVPTASPAPTNTPIPTPTVTPIPAPTMQGIGVTFLEIKEAFALAGYTPILCTLPENYDKYECQGEDTVALYRAPNERVEVWFAGYMNDLRAVGVAMNIDAAMKDNTISNEFIAAEILIAEYVVPLWDLDDRISTSNSILQTLVTYPASEITENIGHVNIKAGINSNGWMIILRAVHNSFRPLGGVKAVWDRRILSESPVAIQSDALSGFPTHTGVKSSSVIGRDRA